MQELSEQQARNVEGGIVEGGCIPPIFKKLPFPTF